MSDTTLEERLHQIANYINPADLNTILDAIEVISGQPAPTDEQIVNALQEVADCTLFDTHDPAACTEEIYKTVSALIEDARAALQGESSSE